jgi:hypothetical protein
MPGRLSDFRALGVRCKGASQDVRVYRTGDPSSAGNRLDSPAEPVLRTHGCSLIAWEDKRISRNGSVPRAPHFQCRQQNVLNSFIVVLTCHLRQSQLFTLASATKIAPLLCLNLKEHDDSLIYIRSQTFFDPLRSEPRFQALLRRMAFPL